MIYSITEGKQAEGYKLKKAREKLEYREKDKNQARDPESIGYKTPRYSTISGERSNSKFASGYKKEDQEKWIKILLIERKLQMYLIANLFVEQQIHLAN